MGNHCDLQRTAVLTLQSLYQYMYEKITISDEVVEYMDVNAEAYGATTNLHPSNFGSGFPPAKHDPRFSSFW
jgi:hypothetical protein